MNEDIISNEFNDMLFQCAEKAFNENTDNKDFDNKEFNKQLADNIRDTFSNTQNYHSVFIFNNKIYIKSMDNKNE